MKKKNHYDKNVYRSLTMITQFGINMIVPIVFMTVLGIFADNKLGTKWVVVVFFFVGAIAGGQNVYRMAKNIYDTPSERDRRLPERNGEGVTKDHEVDGSLKK